MRRSMLFASGLILVLLLAGCGNKGPLVRASSSSAAAPASPATVPAPDVDMP